MTIKNALLLGATGLVGSELLPLLLEDPRYEKVTCLTRKALPMLAHSKKLVEEVLPFKDFKQPYVGAEEAFAADHIYVCLGTTIKKAGSQKAFRHIDFDLVYQAALLAKQQGAKSFVWVSSVGADARSSNFYLQVKGQLEDAILQIPDLDASAIQPSLLLGDRKESRPTEKLGIVLGGLVAPLMIGPLEKYRPIEAARVAKQMIGMQRF